MELQILKDEEKRMNLVFFLFLLAIPIVAFLYVLIFNGGSIRDIVAVLITVGSLCVKALEKPLGAKAKYLYVSLLPLIWIISHFPQSWKFLIFTPNSYFVDIRHRAQKCSMIQVVHRWIIPIE